MPTANMLCDRCTEFTIWELQNETTMIAVWECTECDNIHFESK